MKERYSKKQIQIITEWVNKQLDKSELTNKWKTNKINKQTKISNNDMKWNEDKQRLKDNEQRKNKMSEWKQTIRQNKQVNEDVNKQMTDRNIRRQTEWTKTKKQSKPTQTRIEIYWKTAKQKEWMNEWTDKNKQNKVITKNK